MSHYFPAVRCFHCLESRDANAFKFSALTINRGIALLASRVATALRLRSETTQPMVLERSQDLIDWDGTSTNRINGAEEMLDLNPAEARELFYRLVPAGE